MKQRKPIILIVDDTELNRSFLKDMLEVDYQIWEATNGLEAVSILRQHEMEISLVLLDVVMPKMDGFEVLALMNKNHWIDNLPVVMISAETSPDYISKGYELGAVDYISRPFDTRIVKRRVHNTIMLYTKQKALQNLVTEQIRDNERNNIMMIDILSTIVEFRNGESGLHVLRIRIITEILLTSLAKYYPEYQLSSSDIADISNAAALHDVGKIAIPEEILNKPGKLTEQEFDIVKTHAQKGCEMLGKIRFGKNHQLIKYADSICRWHHERWDGNGYPDGLAGAQIPICAQAVSLADVYDALVSRRVYKPAYSHNRAIEMILNGECGQFNPDLIDCLLREATQLEERIGLQSEQKADLFDDDLFFDIEKISCHISTQKGAGLPDRSLVLLERERLKNQFFSALCNDILFDYDTSTDTIIFSDKANMIFGLEPTLSHASEYLSQQNILASKDYVRFVQEVKALTPQSPILHGEYFFLTSDGARRKFEFIIRAIWLEEMESHLLGYVGKLIDKHEPRLESAQLQQLIQRDPLTGLYNGITAASMIENYLSVNPESSAALLYLDVDDFKMINEVYGHAFGDTLLKYIAKTVGQNIRQKDIAARIEGDEFLIFLLDINNIDSVHQQANRILQALQGNYQGCHFSVSIGISICPLDACHYRQLLSYADQARCTSKTFGKGCFTFYQPDTKG